jgi:predicted site-specific integrase-resolvase
VLDEVVVQAVLVEEIFEEVATRMVCQHMIINHYTQVTKVHKHKLEKVRLVIVQIMMENKVPYLVVALEQTVMVEEVVEDIMEALLEDIARATLWLAEEEVHRIMTHLTSLML